MDGMACRDVSPGAALLMEIFGDANPGPISIFLQTWDKCVFKVDFHEHADNVPRRPVVVRIDTESDSVMKDFILTTTMQRIASAVAPAFVPDTVQVGKATNDDGRVFSLSVVEYVEGETLEDTWEALHPANQKAIIAEIIGLLRQFQSLKPTDKRVLELKEESRKSFGVNSAPTDTVTSLGGPSLGQPSGGSQLLELILKRRQLKHPFCSIDSDNSLSYITLRSVFEDLGSITVNRELMDEWPKDSVFCQNDITPRNIILRSTTCGPD